MPLTGINDELGNNYATFSYDTSGRATASSLADDANQITIEYWGGGTETVNLPAGEPVYYTSTTLQGIPKTSTESRYPTGGVAGTATYTYDTNGFVASKTDWNGNLTTYINNSRGLPTSIVEASGSGVARTTTITWSSSFHLPTEIDTARNTTTFSYDAAAT